MNRRNLALAVAGVAGICALTVISLVLVNRSTPLVEQPANNSPTGGTSTVPTASSDVVADSELAAVSLVLEHELGLESVTMAQRGSVLELRFKTPAISASDSIVLLAGLFDWLNAALPSGGITQLRLVMTADDADIGFAETSRASVDDWKAGTTTSEQFVSSWNRVSLAAAE